MRARFQKIIVLLLLVALGLTSFPIQNAHASVGTQQLNLNTQAITVTIKNPINTNNSYTNNTSPVFSIESSKAGHLSYFGKCGTGDLTEVVAGVNVIHYQNLTDGPYTDCAIQNTDSDGNLSNVLSMSSFILDTKAPVISETKPNIVPAQPQNNPEVYVSEDSFNFSLITSWKVTGKNSDGQPVYQVAFAATDQAGNVSDVIIKSNILLPKDQKISEGETRISPELIGEKTFSTPVEKGSVYTDSGAKISYVGDWAHVWMTGDFDLSKTSPAGKPYALFYNAAQLGTIQASEAVPATRNISVADTTAPGPVTLPQVVPGNGSLQLSWVNPSAEDFDHVSIYRSTTPGVLGDYLGYASATNASFFDSNLTNGQSYFYTLIAYDNASPGNASTPVIVSGTPKGPEVILASTQTPIISDQNTPTPAQNQYKVEAKSKQITNQNTENDSGQSTKSVPIFGFIVLLLLIIFGLYLLYQERPDWFLWLHFWKPKTKKKKK